MGVLVASRASRLWLALIADKPADQVRRASYPDLAAITKDVEALNDA
jgi:hypothetical protein